MKKKSLFLTALWIFPLSAAAHPHAFVTMNSKPLVSGQQLVGFSMQWTLDEPSSAEILYDLQLAKDNPTERQKLFDDMIERIVNEHYFSYLYDIKGNKVKYSAKPQNYGMRAVGHSVQYYFDFMLSRAQDLRDNQFVLSTYDPTYYVSMYYDERQLKTKSAVDFSALPQQCSGEIVDPNVNENTRKYAASLDQTQRDEDPTLGAIFAQKVVISCK